MSLIENLEAMLAKGEDNALLRFSLGNAHLRAGSADEAATHLARAVELDPLYSAAWKLYAKALEASDRPSAAAEAYRRGIAVARKGGDLQAAKEMEVFLRRLERDRGP